MARYFFALVVGGITIGIDNDGEECATLEEAKAVAIQTAQELAYNRAPSAIEGQSVALLDESGGEILRAPLVPSN